MTTPALPDLPVSEQSKVQYNVKVKAIEFADGYSQRVPEGVNNIKRVYTVIFDLCDSTAATTLRDFFSTNSNGAKISAYTKPTDNVLRYWWIQSWNEEMAGPLLRKFTAVLIEDRA